MAVSTELSVVSATAGSGSRSVEKWPSSSPAKCCASAALPPFPKTISLPPRVSAACRSVAKSSSGPCNSVTEACATAACSRRTSSACAHRRASCLDGLFQPPAVLAGVVVGPVLVAHLAPPLLVGQVPVHGRGDAIGERHLRLPAERAEL